MAAANVRGWGEEVLQSIDKTQIEPVDYFYPESTKVGQHKCINGKPTYCRILIRRKDL